jgi:hypothetical protein
MATRKKKIEEAVAEVPVKKPTPIAKREKKEMKVFKPVVKEPTVVKGSHLTVTTFPDGKTVLEWDDEQLLKEVREAIASAELAAMKPAVRAKAARPFGEVIARQRRMQNKGN